jgi:hypothetical protein
VVCLGRPRAGFLSGNAPNLFCQEGHAQNHHLCLIEPGRAGGHYCKKHRFPSINPRAMSADFPYRHESRIEVVIGVLRFQKSQSARQRALVGRPPLSLRLPGKHAEVSGVGREASTPERRKVGIGVRQRCRNHAGDTADCDLRESQAKRPSHLRATVTGPHRGGSRWRSGSHAGTSAPRSRKTRRRQSKRRGR